MTKLSQRDQTILSTIQYHGDQPMRATAAELGLTESAVRRVFTRALEAGILKRRVYVNSFILGLSQWSIFISTSAGTAAQRTRLREVLTGAPGIELLLEVGGQFDYGLVITARSAFDIEAFFDSLTRGSKTPLSGMRVQTRTGWYYFGVKYLSGAHSTRTTAIVPQAATVTLAPSDIDVLQAFSNSRDGNRQRIAQSLGMPLSTVQYRIEHLTRRGVIAAVLYQIVADKIGFEAYRILLSTHFPSRQHRTALLEWAQEHPSVLTFMHGIGNWEYELRVEAPDTRSVRATVDEIQDRFSHFIRSAEIVPVSRVLRMELAPHPSMLQG